MRTTVTIDDRLFHQLREEAAKTRRRFAEVLNDRLRLGLAKSSSGKRRKPQFVVKPFPGGGFAAGVDPTKLNQLFDTLETENRNG